MSILKVEVKDRIATLTLNRPERRNAFGDPQDAVDVKAACDTLNGDDSICCAILTGAGTSFSAGGDVKGMLERAGPKGDPALAHRDRYRRHVHTIVRAFYGLEMPLIAAVNGPAIGLGCDLSCLADIRIASESARFGVTFLALGVIPGDGGAWLLPRAIGMSRASQMLYTAKVVDSHQAMEWGLVSEVVGAESLIERALELAGEIALQPSYALRTAKMLLRQGQTNGLDTLLELSAASQAICHTTPEHADALGRLVSPTR